MNPPSRRHFIGSSFGVAAAGVLKTNRAVAATDKLTMGFMGLGGRMNQLVKVLCANPNVQTKYICDVDQSKFARAAAGIDDVSGESPKRVTDFREMLDDPEVDIIINATWDHWHALGTIMACQAGKHVYVEKPVSVDVWEGRKMVEAARKYNCIVQSGMQNRSCDYHRKAIELIQSGKLGSIHQTRVIEMLNMSRTYDFAPRPLPDGLDWDMYCGPSPLVPYTDTNIKRVHWDFSCGIIFDDAIHQLDVARWVTGATYPHAVHCAGGIMGEDDGRQVPDTQVITWEYEDMLMTHQGSLMCPYLKKTPESARNGDQFPDWLMNATRIEIYGTEGMMLLGRQGGGWQVYGPDGGLVAQQYGRHEVDTHFQNFVDCIRTGERPNGDIEEGHISAALAHIGNISYRVGHRQLQWDGNRERFINDDEANALLRRKHRKPWVIPENV